MTNSAVVGLASGWANLAFYVVFVVSLAMVAAELLRRRWSLERSLLATLLAMLGLAGLLVSIWARVHHMAPWVAVRDQVGSTLDALVQSSPANNNWLGLSDAEEWKRATWVELPSAFLVFALAWVWVNFQLLLRINPGRVRESLGLAPDFARRWKAPDWMVWPTILCGFLLIWETGLATDIALNLFKVLMAIYAVQGLSVLSFFFEAWHLRGFMRTLGYLLALFLLMPLLLGLGFFDLWFDFRGKLRQS